MFTAAALQNALSAMAINPEGAPIAPETFFSDGGARPLDAARADAFVTQDMTSFFGVATREKLRLWRRHGAYTGRLVDYPGLDGFFPVNIHPLSRGGTVTFVNPHTRALVDITHLRSGACPFPDVEVTEEESGSDHSVSIWTDLGIARVAPTDGVYLVNGQISAERSERPPFTVRQRVVWRDATPVLVQHEINFFDPFLRGALDLIFGKRAKTSYPEIYHAASCAFTELKGNRPDLEDVWRAVAKAPDQAVMPQLRLYNWDLGLCFQALPAEKAGTLMLAAIFSQRQPEVDEINGLPPDFLNFYRSLLTLVPAESVN